jgi:hypothetical protein
VDRLRRYLSAEAGKPVIETWEPDRPAPLIWPDTAANRGLYSPRWETPLVVTPDFAFWEYRRRAGLSWADVSGQWPQPRWRTRLDRLYYRLVDEADAERNPR